MSTADCTSACSSKADECGGDSSECTSFCAAGVSSAEVSCLGSLDCSDLASGGFASCEASGSGGGSSCSCNADFNGSKASISCGTTECVGGESIACSSSGEIDDLGACTGTGTGTGTGSGSGSGSGGGTTNDCPSGGNGDVPGTACTDNTTCETFVCYCNGFGSTSSGSIQECTSGQCAAGTDACAINCEGAANVASAVGCKD